MAKISIISFDRVFIFASTFCRSPTFSKNYYGQKKHFQKIIQTYFKVVS